MTSKKPEKIPSRRKAAAGNVSNGGGTSTMSNGGGTGSGRRWPWSSSFYGRRDEPVVRRKAWYLKSFLCREATEDNLENMRKVLSICQAVKTEVKLTPSCWSSGKRSRNHRVKRIKVPLDYVTSIEQDEVFVNVLLCYFELDNMPDDIQYEIAAYKFHDTADVRAIVAAFRQWGRAGPIEKSPSVIDGGSAVLVRSALGGSLHSLAMPGRPTTGALAPDRWVAVDRGVSNAAPRRYYSQSVGDLTAATGSEVFYPTNGYRTAPPRSVLAGGGALRQTSAIGGYRQQQQQQIRRSTPEQQTLTSDEGNGSLSFSDQQRQQVMCREVDVSINEPVDPHLQPVLNYQRNRPYAQNHLSVADIACQVVLPDGYDARRLSSMSSYSSGTAMVVTGGGGGTTTRMTRSSGIGYDYDDDDMSTVSGISSSVAFDVEPGLATGRFRSNGDVMTNGTAVAHVNGYGRRQYNSVDVFDDVDTFDRRRMSNGDRPVVPDMSSTVRRVYTKPSYSGGGSATGYSQDAEYSTRRSRYQSDSNFLQVPGSAAQRSRSVDPHFRYVVGPTSGARSDIGVGYRTNGGGGYVDNSDAVSMTSTARQVMQQAAYVHPTFEKRYIARSGTASGGSVYRQVPRPSRGSTSSGYGGVRSKTMSHRRQ